MSLGARLAQTLIELAEQHANQPPSSARVAIQLAQKDLAQLLGASRQRVNEQLKRLEEKNIIRLGVGSLIIEDIDILRGIGQLVYED
jgi:CRP-like cAMP-binding protein